MNNRQNRQKRQRNPMSEWRTDVPKRDQHNMCRVTRARAKLCIISVFVCVFWLLRVPIWLWLAAVCRRVAACKCE